ncbi:hypothetical protein EVAR_90624_1 [Eumeta japonica]|uniref:Uncharacterized protein n=1 Tax=Eumeta variegata TaxID=151549 RepID=A0A4C1ZWC0_EUMVA|nr:hypothetical protein EVAR_90624_1 [Eumeta japonica]
MAPSFVRRMMEHSAMEFEVEEQIRGLAAGPCVAGKRRLDNRSKGDGCFRSGDPSPRQASPRQQSGLACAYRCFISIGLIFPIQNNYIMKLTALESIASESDLIEHSFRVEGQINHRCPCTLATSEKSPLLTRSICNAGRSETGMMEGGEGVWVTGTLVHWTK